MARAEALGACVAAGVATGLLVGGGVADAQPAITKAPNKVRAWTLRLKNNFPMSSEYLSLLFWQARFLVSFRRGLTTLTMLGEAYQMHVTKLLINTGPAGLFTAQWIRMSSWFDVIPTISPKGALSNLFLRFAGIEREEIV